MPQITILTEEKLDDCIDIPNQKYDPLTCLHNLYANGYFSGDALGVVEYYFRKIEKAQCEKTNKKCEKERVSTGDRGMKRETFIKFLQTFKIKERK